MTEEKLAKLEALCNAATPGPWFTVGFPWGDDTLIYAGSDDPHCGTFICDTRMPVEDEDAPPRNQADADFIADARTFMPLLIARIREQRKQIEHLTNALRGKGNPYDD